MDKNQQPAGGDERKTLHDLANALTIAQGKLALLVRQVQQSSEPISQSEMVQKLDQILSTMNRMADLIHVRRETLK
jgi:hypothetical protein